MEHCSLGLSCGPWSVATGTTAVQALGGHIGNEITTWFFFQILDNFSYSCVLLQSTAH